MRNMIAAMMLGLAAMPAAAQTKTGPDKLFDATKPAEIADALRETGYKAVLKSNDKGEPVIESAANGSPFTIEFYGCKGATDCGSFQFYGWYKKEPLFTIALANEWNTTKRFVKVSIDKEGDLVMWMDVSGVGGMTQAAFADWVDWYAVMDNELSKFLGEKRAAVKGAGGK